MPYYHAKITIVAAIIVALAGFASAQLKTAVPPIPAGALKSVAGTSLLDPSRMQMSHGFSMSFLSGSGNMPGGSMSVYTNQFSYLLRDNLILDSQIHLAQSAATYPGDEGLDVYFKTGLQWHPTESFHLQIGISNIPRYYQRGYGLMPRSRSYYFDPLGVD